MAERFQIGDRVRMTRLGEARMQRMKRKATTGTVKGYSKTGQLYVLRDGTRREVPYAPEFWERIKK